MLNLEYVVEGSRDGDRKSSAGLFTGYWLVIPEEKWCQFP